eukprot:TRINITY_DN10888_c0_g1_i2.p1 TRINITY_DN10888_c0_g1~~TRINITY_DN10888_c0_g1_i2.p1  ORF type:complete len:624 (-),score=100.01 TRINITY_DN10888_c0_g1_i2:251-2122(-)
MNSSYAHRHALSPTACRERASSPLPWQSPQVPSRARRSPVPTVTRKHADPPAGIPAVVRQRVDAGGYPAASLQTDWPRVAARTSPVVQQHVDAASYTTDPLLKTLLGRRSGGSVALPQAATNCTIMTRTQPVQRGLCSTQRQLALPVASTVLALDSRSSIGQPSPVPSDSVPSDPVPSDLCTDNKGAAEIQKESETQHLEEIESQVKSDPNFSEELRTTRLAALGLDMADTKAFMDKVEFISLGTFCAISTTLQSLGVRKGAYPFDWVRSPLSGVVHLLNSQFEDFLTYTSSRKEANYHVFCNTRWGGSFWHHDPEAEGTCEEFTRRIERFYGIRGVPTDSSRFFIRALNSTTELSQIRTLLNSLKRCFPNAKNYLLVLIDAQQAADFYQVQECGENTLFFCVNKSVWETQPHIDANNAGVRGVMDRAANAYSEGIAKAIMWWSAKSGRSEDVHRPTHVARLDDLSARLSHFDAGCPSNESFWPRRFRGQRIQLARPSQADSNFQQQGAGPGLLEPMPELLADVCLPAGIKAGDYLETEAFGRPIKVTVPEGSHEGRLLRLRYYQGVVSCSLAAAATAVALTATAATAATTATAAAAATAATAATPCITDEHVLQVQTPRESC